MIFQPGKTGSNSPGGEANGLTLTLKNLRELSTRQKRGRSGKILLHGLATTEIAGAALDLRLNQNFFTPNLFQEQLFVLALPNQPVYNPHNAREHILRVSPSRG